MASPRDDDDDDAVLGGLVDAAALARAFGRPVRGARRRSMREDEKLGGLSGEFSIVEVLFEDATTTELVLKTTRPGGEAVAAALGTAREGRFFATLARDVDELAGVVPRCFAARGDVATGAKAVLLEKVAGVPLGVFFGRGNPNNWNCFETDAALAAFAASNGGIPAREATSLAFRACAALHAHFWRFGGGGGGGREGNDEWTWLRGATWLSGAGRDDWERAQRLASDAWTKIRRDVGAEENASVLRWDSHLVACLDAAFGKLDWDAFQRELAERPHTLVHGDCHPHNVLYRRHPDDGGSVVVLIDFEMVGLGSGPQDLGQFVVSHAAPDERRAWEHDVVREYHAALVAALRARDHPDAATYSFDACWREYAAGGAGRWLWFVPYLATVCPPAMAHFFNDQLAAFLRDHFPDPADAPMPRA